MRLTKICGWVVHILIILYEVKSSEAVTFKAFVNAELVVYEKLA